MRQPYGFAFLMPLAKLTCLTFVGIKHIPVSIEVHISSGLPAFAIVGLADTEVRESKERVRSALINSGFEFPSQRITVNLAPADLPKGSATFDLAIALGIASASGQLPNAELENWIFAGELSLSGRLTSARAPYALAVAARKEFFKNEKLKLMLPHQQAASVAEVPDIPLFGPETLFEAASHLVGHGEPMQPLAKKSLAVISRCNKDFNEVIGHEAAKQALLVAASGHHHIRLVGSPGTGKSMLAQRLDGLLPPLDLDQALDNAAIQNMREQTHALSLARPFRNPHPSTSVAAFIGGGYPPAPGEITLANLGVLFTDEILEFDRRCIEALREPLEAGKVNISRAGRQASFPAKFLWVCAHNPCPCGWLGHPVKECRCTPEQVRRYQNKLSGPIADRLDISIEVAHVDHEELMGQNGQNKGQTSTAEMALKVRESQELQLQRQGCLNGELSPGAINKHCKSSVDAEKLLLSYANKHHLSSRAVHRIVRVARTVADLNASETLSKTHIATAIQFRKHLVQRSTPLN